MVEEKSLVSIDKIEQIIKILRGQKVILSSEIAKLYEVETKVLMQAVKRNIERFPDDFMFQLSLEEASRSQNVTLKRGQNIKYLPYAFTEQGVAMLSSVLKSKRAKYDIQFKAVFDAIRQLMAPPKPKKNQIGFHWEEAPAPTKKPAPAKKQASVKKPAQKRMALKEKRPEVR